MADLGKRKGAHDTDGGGSFKKKKKGNNGKWKAPKSGGSTKPKADSVEPGDIGIWVTCPLHMKGKAAREMEVLFDEYAEKLYGIKSDAPGANGSDDEDGDIESAIQKEVGSLKDKAKGVSDRVFTEVRINQECLLFMRCKAPVDPVEFSRRICQDASTVGHGGAQARYLNRLTPVSIIVKATEGGLEDAARQTLANIFKLKPKETKASVEAEATDGGGAEANEGTSNANAQPVTYAIRTSIRNHSTLKRDDVINRIANLVDPQHKVNLGAPDNVILVDIYQASPQPLHVLSCAGADRDTQTVCGMSVVPGDWDSLKRYNLTELYKKTNTVVKEADNDVKESDKNPSSKTEGTQ